jgi:transcriptional regulator with XRE-family HTH domain
LRYAEMFERLLGMYPHPDGGRWTGPKMEEATGGFVNASYFSNLLNGRIKQPGLDKLKAIAEAMDFPPELWLEEPERWGKRLAPERGRSSSEASLAKLLDNLFESIPDERTSRPLSEAEIARRSAGKLTMQEIRDMRAGKLTNPNMEQILALSAAFDVDPSYWFRRGKKQPLVDQRTVEALRDRDNRLLLHRSLNLSKDHKDMLLILMEQLKERDKD